MPRSHRLLLIAGIALPAALFPLPGLSAQRPARVGPLAAVIGLERGSATESYRGYGGLFGWLSGDDNEITATVMRFADISADSLPRAMTVFAVGSTYYPVGADRLAPYLVSELGLVRYTRSTLGGLFGSSSTETTSELLIAAGFGFRFTADQLEASVEGRFSQVVGVEAGLEARAHVGLAFGAVRKTELLGGTVGPASGYVIHLGGAGRYVSRFPAAGVRFRRYTIKRQSASLDVLYAPVSLEDSAGNELFRTEAVVFAPGYQASLFSDWGRPYFEVGGFFAGFTEGEDKGIRSGVHAGFGADVYAGNASVNLNARVVWFQRVNGDNSFSVMIGVGVAPKLPVPSPR